MLYVKKIIILVVCIFSVQFLTAQNNYVTHTLKQGENLSMLAKEYNTSVGDIMRMNGMHADTKLVYGSQIKIPSTKNNVSAAKKETAANIISAPKVATSSNEITHIVAKGETLYSISKKYNITVDEIKAWNNLTDNSAKLGTLLIINNKVVNKPAAMPAQKQSAETVTTPVQQTTQPVVNNDIKTEPAKADVKVVENNNPAPVAQPITQEENNAPDAATNQTNIDYKGTGYFASQFANKKASETQNVSGISKIFKTASGWADGKYYILANDIEPGTIVKITSDNGNAVFAKVLWNLGDMKENSGINFRISNATAAALHENTDSFNVSLSF